MQYQIVTVYRQQDQKWTNEVPGITRDMFARHSTREEAVVDGKLLSAVLGIHYGEASLGAKEEIAYEAAKTLQEEPSDFEETEYWQKGQTPRRKESKAIAAARQTEKIACPPTKAARIQIIRELEEPTGAINAVGFAKLGIAWPPYGGWKDHLIQHGW